MSFLLNALDSIPVVGTVKAAVHYAVGDTDGGNKALYQSTRTTAVLAAGAAGCIAGPAGGAVAAMYAGAATDMLASVAMDKPQGLIQSCGQICEDVSVGRNPTTSIVSTGLVLGLDGLGGFGMGGISSAASKVSEKAVVNTVENVGKKVVTIVGEEVIEKSVGVTAKEIVKIATKQVTKKAIELAAIQTEVVLVTTHIGLNAKKRIEEEIAEREEREYREKEEREKRAKEERDKRAKEEREKRAKEERDKRAKEERDKRAKEERERANEEKQTRATSSGSSQPPQRNEDDNKKSKKKSDPDYFDILMELLRDLLKRIYGNEPEPFSTIFKTLSEGQVKYLVKTIQKIYKYGTLNEVVELVIRIFKEYFPEDISFTNFLSLLEFVQTFISDKVNDQDMIERGAQTTQPNMDNKRRKRIVNDIMRQTGIVQEIVALFKKLRAEINAETSAPNNILSPDFRDMFAAVYHYFKHKCVPEDGILTVKEYLDWIRKFLKKLKETPHYAKLTSPIKFEIYVSIFGRRFRIVVKLQDGKYVLSSAYVVDLMYPDDEEGDVFINNRKYQDDKDVEKK